MKTNHRSITLVIIVILLFSGVTQRTIIVHGMATPIADVWQFPLDGSWSPIGEEFDVFNGEWNGWHLGQDIMRTSEVPVYAAANGYVRYSGAASGYGHVVIIEHQLQDGTSLTSLYGHLKSTGLISNNTNVLKGTIIGYLSGDRNENGGYDFIHLHFGIREGPYDYSQSYSCGGKKTWLYRGYSCTTDPFSVSHWRKGSDFILQHSGNFAVVSDIPNPDTYSCYQNGNIDFEAFPDKTNLSALTIPGIQFTTTMLWSWLVGDFSSGNYNGKYQDGNGAYTSQGTHWAWLGVIQGSGQIKLTQGSASYFSLLVSDLTPVTLDAYDKNENYLASAISSSSNTNTGHMTQLFIHREVADIASVFVHDSGNYFEIDEICTDSAGVPKKITTVVNQPFFMVTGQPIYGTFIVDLDPNSQQYLHIVVGPFFSDVDLQLTRPDGSVVSSSDPGVTYNKTDNSVEMAVENAPPGEWRYEIIPNHLDLNGENISIVVEEEAIPQPNLPPTLTVLGDQTVQYSDTLSFGISANDPETTDTLVLGASGLPNGLSFTDNGDRTGTVSGTALVPAGTYPVTFSVSDGYNPPVLASLNIVVSSEDAVVTPATSNPVSVKVNSAGGTAGPITLTAAITEANDDTTNGDIANAQPVNFTLTPVGSGSPITCTATTSGGGVGGTLTASCTFTNVQVNVYDVHIAVGGNYYTGAGDSVLAVYDPSLGFVTGGGTVMHNGVVSNFGFNVKYLSNGKVQGNALYIEHRATGDVMLKSNAMGSLSIVKNSSSSYSAIILGKATLNGVGNYSFQVYATDNGEPGTGDQFGLQVKSPSGQVVNDLTFTPLTLTGGNIQIPHK